MAVGLATTVSSELLEARSEMSIYFSMEGGIEEHWKAAKMCALLSLTAMLAA